MAYRSLSIFRFTAAYAVLFVISPVYEFVGAPKCFEKVTDVSRGEIFVSSESLTTLFSAKLATANTKISDLKIEHTANRAILSGKLEKMIPVFFTISGPVSTNGSEIRMDATSIKADGIPVKALMGMVGEHLNTMLQLKGMDGIKVEDNSLSFSPEAVANLHGHISGVSTSAQGLTLRYGPEHVARNVAQIQQH